MHSSGSFPGLRVIAVNTVAAFSVFIFAFSVLSLHQERSIPFPIEQNGPFSVALSHFLFGAPRGLADSSLNNFFWYKIPIIPAEESLERAIKDVVEPVNDWAPITDGNGIGGIVMVRLAFAVFGIHARALSYFFVLVIGLSAAAFIFRFQDKRIFAVPVLFTTFTALILTPISLLPAAAQVPFGGIRSYSIIGLLAALHWCFDLTIHRESSRLSEAARWSLLGVQIGVLGLAILVRGSPAYLLGPVAIGGGYHLFQNWGKHGLRAVMKRFVVPAAMMVAVLSSIAPLAFPEYAKSGRAHSVVWHRILISFGFNPAWPFPGVREAYPCPEIAEGFISMVGDRNGHCVWWAYSHEHGLSTEQVVRGVYSGEYEAAMRGAVLYLVWKYPKEVLDTFFYFKPVQLITVTRDMLNLQAADQLFLIELLTMFQMGSIVAFIIAWPVHRSLRDAAYSAGFVLLFLAFALIPQLVAWALPGTVIDFLVLLMCAGIVGCWLILAALAEAIATFVPSGWRFLRVVPRDNDDPDRDCAYADPSGERNRLTEEQSRS